MMVGYRQVLTAQLTLQQWGVGLWMGMVKVTHKIPPALTHTPPCHCIRCYLLPTGPDVPTGHEFVLRQRAQRAALAQFGIRNSHLTRLKPTGW